MARTEELLEAIVADVRAQLPKLRSCEVHDGRWDAAEVRRWTIRAPAVLVAWLGTPRTEIPGERWTDCEQQLAAFVVTRDSVIRGAKLTRGEAARSIVDWLLLYIPRARWGLARIGPATDLRAQNLYSGAVDKKGVAMWSVMWRQILRLETAADGTCPPLPEEIYSSAEEDPHEIIHPEEEI